ncbi:hypothetical protein [Streptomyces avermitilis]|uniref:hypothetical protein n=1 Tax=Streptomyces avermitilis TaxID=33903 RepID=UPI0033A2F79C
MLLWAGYLSSTVYELPLNSQPSVPSPMSAMMISSMKRSSRLSSRRSPASQRVSMSIQSPRLASMRRGGGASVAAFAFVVAGFDEAADFVLAVLDGVGEGFGGDDGDVFVGGVDEVAVAAADVVFGV